MFSKFIPNTNRVTFSNRSSYKNGFLKSFQATKLLPKPLTYVVLSSNHNCNFYSYQNKYLPLILKRDIKHYTTNTHNNNNDNTNTNNNNTNNDNTNTNNDNTKPKLDTTSNPKVNEIISGSEAYYSFPERMLSSFAFAIVYTSFSTVSDEMHACNLQNFGIDVISFVSFCGVVYSIFHCLGFTTATRKQFIKNNFIAIIFLLLMVIWLATEKQQKQLIRNLFKADSNQ